MAVIEVSAVLTGASDAQAAAGLRISASAACHGMASAAQPQRAPQRPVPEMKKPKGS